MDRCPKCNAEIRETHFDCEFRCHSIEFWWCDECGSAAVGFDSEFPDAKDWNLPKLMKGPADNQSVEPNKGKKWSIDHDNCCGGVMSIDDW